MGIFGSHEFASDYAQELCGKDTGINRHIARPIIYEELKTSDVIYVMENWHKDNLVSMYPDLEPKIFLLHHEGIDISDPDGGTRDDYVQAYTIINQEINILVRNL